MRIALIGSNGGSGGLIGYIKGLISADVVPEGWSVKLFCGGELAAKLGDTDSKIDICITELAIEKPLDRILNLKLPNDFVNLVNSFKPDLILFLHGYIRRGFDHVPNIMVLHNQLLIDSSQFFRQGFSKTTLKLFISKFITLRSMRNADNVIFLSPFSMNQTIEKGIRFKKGTVIPFGMEEENRLVEVPIKEYGPVIKMLYISAMFGYKNQLELVKACAMLKKDGYNFELKLVGQENKWILRKIQKVIRKNNMINNITIIDWVDHSRIKNLIDESDIFVYASSIETTGYGLLEGMARGSVIVSSNEAGFPEMLGDGGIYFNPQNPSDIYRSLVKIINLSKSQKNKMAQKALERSLGYSWEKTAKEHYGLFATLGGHHVE